MSEKFIDAWIGPKNSRVYQDEKGNLTVKEDGTVSWRNNSPGNLIKLDFISEPFAILTAGAGVI